jgi:predicted DNA-binding transcriptional regulator AlpA
MAANAPATDCKTVVVAASPNCRPEFVRLPIKGLCPFTGLSRSKIYTLILPHEDNDFRPPVRSVSLRKPGQIKGTRLVVLESLLAYLRDEVEVFQRSIGKGAGE